MGKTKNWIDFVVAGIRQYERIYPDQNYHCVLAVPRHKLGDEVSQRLAEHGITAHVYRGREAPDPDTANQKMCRELKRTEEITSALGDVARQACKNSKGECPAFKICGYQAQQKQKPQVWIVPHQLLFRERPDFIPKPEHIAIDEAFWNASLNGIERPKVVMLDELEKTREIRLSAKRGGGVNYSATADLT